MSSSSRQVDYTLVHPAPGHSKPLDWVPKEGDELYVGQPLPTALLQDSVTSVMFAGDDNVKKAFLPLLTTRELLMLRFMNAVTDKPEWQEKVTDDEIVARWRSETVPPNSVNEATMTDLMFDFCIAELRHKAKDVYSDPKTPIVVYNADVVKSDTAVPESVKIALQEAVKALEDVPSREKDWHPGSNEMVLDLVHPSLFPLIYGKSRVLKVGEKVVGREECIARCGEGEVLESGETQKKANAKGGDDDNEGQDGEDEDEENDDSYYYRRRPDLNPYSSKFQWLPCEVDISGDDAKIISYINNLHPKHAKLYGLVEKVVDAALPLWERTLAPLQSANGLQFFTRIICDGTEYEDDDEEENGETKSSGSDGDHESSREGGSEGDEENKGKELTKSLLTNVKGEKDAGEERDEDAKGDDDDYEPEGTEENEGEENGGDEGDAEGDEEGDEGDDEDDDEEEEARVVIQPNPEPFAADKFHLHKSLSFKELYGQKGRPLQVIVKLANIELTPEKPKYEGGTWHVEGKQNEHICATALYYYSSSNIKTSHLAFKQFVETDFPEGFNYEQNDHAFLTEYFGLENEEAGVQYVGEVETKEGRLLTFPNILQHQVQPFELEDPTKSGHRKIVALFLVDPNVRVVSTAHVPTQQVDWWRESSETGKGTAATATVVATGLSKLPVELKDQVFDSIEEFPITLREAKELREELMEERKRFVRDHAHAVKENNAFSLCEH